MKVLYSYNKRGFEAAYWAREIAGASSGDIAFVPFNHDPFLEPSRYVRAQLLDNPYYTRDPGLLGMYQALREQIRTHRPDVLLVDTRHPYHPEFLRDLDLYKVLRVADGPAAAYDRDFAYLHADDHLLYHIPAYSRDLGMAEKLAYCGARRFDFWPLAVFDSFCRPHESEEKVFAARRDIDIIFVGALYVDKMPFLAAIRRAFGRRFQIHGLANWKKNLYFNLKYRAPAWVQPIRVEDYVPLYRRSLLGVNAHLRGKYTVGSYQLFDLPANGIAQLSNGGEFLHAFYEPGREIDAYEDANDVIRMLDHYLSHPREREEIARAGYRCAMAEHRIAKRLRDLRDILTPALRG